MISIIVKSNILIILSVVWLKIIVIMVINKLIRYRIKKILNIMMRLLIDCCNWLILFKFKLLICVIVFWKFFNWWKFIVLFINEILNIGCLSIL